MSDDKDRRLGAQRSKARRQLTAARAVLLVAVLGLGAAAAAIAGGYQIARETDARASEQQHVAMRSAVSEFRALFANGGEVDPRFLRMIAQSAGVKTVRFDVEPPPDARNLQPVLSEKGRILGFLTWETQGQMTQAMDRLAPLLAGAGFGLVGFVGFSLWQLRRSRIALAESEGQAQTAAQHDALTGLPNESRIQSLLDAAVAQSRGEIGLTYAMMSLGGLGAIAESAGQNSASEVIAIVGERLSKLLPEDITCGRVSEQTFAFLWQSERDAGAVLRDAIEGAMRPHWIDSMVRIWAQAGFAHAAPDTASGDELRRRAELALRAAERKGPGAIVAFENAIDLDVGEQQFIRRELPRALKAQALDVHYQPIIASAGGGINGVEALLRWAHKEHGNIPPAKFVPVAEQIGLMEELGLFVLRRALRDAKNWPGLYVSVNLSPLQVCDRRIVDHVREALRQSGVAPSRLLLEITEGVLIDNPEEMLRRITELRAIGVRIALDDFGAGYSSLGYLQRFTFDKLKIDRSFVAALGRSPNAAVIIQAIVALGRALGVTVVVEGVETEEQRVLLRLAGCDEMQGFLFAHPAPAKAMDALIASAPGARSAA